MKAFERKTMVILISPQELRRIADKLEAETRGIDIGQRAASVTIDIDEYSSIKFIHQNE